MLDRLRGSAAPRFSVVQTTSTPQDAAPSSHVSVFEVVFLALFAQISALIFLSLVLQKGPTFVGREPFAGLGMDFFDFHRAASYLVNHVNPYLERRFVTPPFSLLVGLPYQRLSFQEARYAWLLVNLACIGSSLAAFGQQIALSRRQLALLYMSAALYYPAYFVLERGNLDGVMLALMVFAFRARNRLVAILLYGASIALKLYSGLLVVVFARQKRWLLAAGGALSAFLLQLPWWHLLPTYTHVLTGRTEQFHAGENISPSMLVAALFQAIGMPGWKLGFLLLWCGTLAWTLFHLRHQPSQTDWVRFVPWMISLPFVVYPYTAVLTLPLFALVAKNHDQNPLDRSAKIIVAGFILSATQQNAWVELLSGLTRYASWIYFLNSIGTALLLIGCCLAARRSAALHGPTTRESL